MKIKKRIAAIILLGCCAGLTTPAIAQKKNKLKKGPNISLIFPPKRQYKNDLSEFRFAH